MTKESFELYTLKGGQWLLDCVFDTKQDATNEAWRLLNAGHFEGVKVIRESYDERTNKATAVTVFNRLKGDEIKPVARPKTEPNTYASHARVKTPIPKQNRGAVHHLGMITIAVCVVLLGLIGIAFYLIDRF